MASHTRKSEVVETRSTVVSVDGEEWFIIQNIHDYDYGDPEVKRLASEELWKLWSSCPKWITAVEQPDGTYRFACAEELEAKIRPKITETHPWQTVRLYPPCRV